ncbi:MAG TPA: hypothetical protein VI461_09135 [Chitinophagaceae bacterium]|nr:hypothetical protein [Chitinophagaceae bacterium]
MGNNKKSPTNSRRSFLSSFFSGKNNVSSDTSVNHEKVKMLTADGKLVEVDKVLLDKAVNRFKAKKKDIFNWMNNPSKEK